MQYFVDGRIPLKNSQHRAALSPMDVRMHEVLPLGDQSTLVVAIKNNLDWLQKAPTRLRPSLPKN